MSYRGITFAMVVVFSGVNLVAHTRSVERRLPEGLCEAIKTENRSLFDYYINKQDINSCVNQQNLNGQERAASGVLGAFMLPFAPLFWYMAFHEEPETPLSTAVWYKQIIMLSEIIDRGAQINKQDSMGYTALHWASSAMTGQDVYHAIVKLLLAAGARPSLHIRDFQGRMPFHWAVVKGNHAIARTLLNEGADVNARDNSGKTPLHLAYLGRDEKMISLLYSFDARDMMDNEGKYPSEYLKKEL